MSTECKIHEWNGMMEASVRDSTTFLTTVVAETVSYN